VSARELKSSSNSPPGKGYSWLQANKADRISAESGEIVIFVTPIVLKDVVNQGQSWYRKVSGDFKNTELEELRDQYDKLKEPEEDYIREQR
jgi:hypothetical protein